MYRYLFLFSLSFALVAGSAFASKDHHDEDHDHPETDAVEASEISVPPNQAVVRVNGLVCSFCAHGAEKALSKLEGLDRSKYRKGVLVEVDQHRITLALVPGRPIVFSEIHESIRSGGYDPVRYHVRVKGMASQHENGWIFEATDPPQVFVVAGLPEGLSPEQELDLQLQVDAAVAAKLQEGQPTPATIDAVH